MKRDYERQWLERQEELRADAEAEMVNWCAPIRHERPRSVLRGIRLGLLLGLCMWAAIGFTVWAVL